MRDVDDGRAGGPQIAQDGEQPLGVARRRGSTSARPGPAAARSSTGRARSRRTAAARWTAVRSGVLGGEIWHADAGRAAARCRRASAGDRAAAAARRACGSRPRNTLPATSSVSMTSSSWWMMPMPRRAASAGPCIATGAPSMRISPASARWMPARIFISVDLPAPFSPTSADDLAGRHVEVHAIERDDAGKPLGDRRHLQ